MVASRRSFLKVLLASPIIFQVLPQRNARAVNAVWGFGGFIENMNVELYEEASEAYMQAAVDLGANHVLLNPRLEYKDGKIRNKDGHTHAEYAFDLYLETAIRKGLKPFVGLGIEGDLGDRPSSTEISRYLDERGQWTLRYADKADRANAPFFDLFGEIEFVFRFKPDLASRGTSLLNEWLKELVPQLRTKFHGRLIPKAVWSYEDIPVAEDVTLVSVVKKINWSHFDGFGLDAYPAGARTPQQYGDKLDEMINEATQFAQSHGIPQIMITESGAPVGGDLVTSHPIHHSANPVIITESIQLACTEEILKRSSGKTEGLFFWGMDAGWHPNSIIGRPAGDLVLQEWGGQGPNRHADTAPSIIRTDMHTAVADYMDPFTVYQFMDLLFWVSDISGAGDVKSVTIVGSDGGDLSSIRTHNVTDQWTHFEGFSVDGGGHVISTMLPEVKVSLLDKHGNSRTQIAVPSKFMPRATPRFTGDMDGDTLRVSRKGKITFSIPTSEYGSLITPKHIGLWIMDESNRHVGEYSTSNSSVREVPFSALGARLQSGIAYYVQLVVRTEESYLIHLEDGSIFFIEIDFRDVVRQIEILP